MSNWVFATATNSHNRYAFKKLNDFALLSLYKSAYDDSVIYTIFPIVNSMVYADNVAALVCLQIDFVDLEEATKLLDERIGNSYISDDFISWNHGKYNITISHGKSTIFSVVHNNELVKKIDFHETIVLGGGDFPHVKICGSLYGKNDEYIKVLQKSYSVASYIPETV